MSSLATYTETMIMHPSIPTRVIRTVGTPSFIYSEETIVRNVSKIREAAERHGLADRVHLSVPYFVNSNPHLFKILEGLGAGATIQNVEENEQLEEFGLNIPRIVSPTHLSDKDLDYFLARGIPINLATLSNLERAVELNLNGLRLRIDIFPDQDQRHGIKLLDFPRVKELLGNRKLKGIHVYPGTSSDLEACLRFQKRALGLLKEFPSITELNLGGGFSFDYQEKDNEKQHFDWVAYFGRLKERIASFKMKEDVNFVLEPGRDILADSGVLVLRVTGMEKPSGKNYHEVYTDGSYVLMPSAMLKGRQHQVAFFDADGYELREEDQDGLPAKLNGNTTLTSDRILPGIVYIPPTIKTGDYVIIRDVGSYGATQHLEFLNKAPAIEMLAKTGNSMEVISRRGSLTDKTRNIPK